MAHTYLAHIWESPLRVHTHSKAVFFLTLLLIDVYLREKVTWKDCTRRLRKKDKKTHHSYVWTEALSGMTFVPAQNQSGILGLQPRDKGAIFVVNAIKFLVPSGEKCFRSWPPVWPPWRHVQTSNSMNKVLECAQLYANLKGKKSLKKWHWKDFLKIRRRRFLNKMSQF